MYQIHTEKFNFRWFLVRDTIDDADLEEGELASDDEEVTQQDKKQEDKTVLKCSAIKGEVTKEDLKIVTLNQCERQDSLNLKTSVANTEKRRDKRVPSNSNSSRSRKRAGEDDVPSHHRDSHVCGGDMFRITSSKSIDN